MSAGTAKRLRQVEETIAAAARAAGRGPGAVRLIAVSKTVPPEGIREAIAAGQRLFGENRVQEAQAKWPALKEEFSDLELHLIGPLQSNKARDAVALFDVIHSVDREKIAQALVQQMERQGRRPRLLVQVNTGEEPQKAGVAPQDTKQFIAACRERYGLVISGLMCIPPLEDAPAPHFALMAQLAGELGLPELSMGMSADYEMAIAFGATFVRIGTAIFGERS